MEDNVLVLLCANAHASWPSHVQSRQFVSTLIFQNSKLNQHLRVLISLLPSWAEDILWLMTVKPFSNELTEQILSQIDAYLRKNEGPHYAAFDADGTLWDSDVGENFFQYQIDFCSLPALKTMDPWKHYNGLKKIHPPDAYLWLAQLCSPFPVEEIREWAEETLTSFPPVVLEAQKTLIHELLKRKIKVFVVSASTHWAVEAAVTLVGLTAESALGVKTKVVNGLVTKEQDGPITWREGKRIALLEKPKAWRPCCAQETHLATYTSWNALL